MEAMDTRSASSHHSQRGFWALIVTSNENTKEAAEKLAQTDLPALWRPRANQFVRIEAIPYLGTGKLDLRKVKELAAPATKAEETTA